VGAARTGCSLGIHPSSVHRVLPRYRLAKLAWLDRGTGRVIRRYEHEKPEDLVHVNIKKLGRIPDGGGRRNKHGIRLTAGHCSEGLTQSISVL